MAALRGIQGALVNIYARPVVSSQEEPFPARALVAAHEVDTVLVTLNIRIQTFVDICKHNSDVNSSANNMILASYP